MCMYVHRFGDWNRSLVVENVPQREGVPVQLGVAVWQDHIQYGCTYMKWPEKTSPQRQKIIGCRGLMEKKGQDMDNYKPQMLLFKWGKTSGLLRQGFAKYLRMVSKSQESSCPSFMSTSNTVLCTMPSSKAKALCYVVTKTFYLGPFPFPVFFPVLLWFF